MSPARPSRSRDDARPWSETTEIDSGRGNAHGLARRAHSVLSNDLVDVAGHPTRIALERVLTFLHERLWPPGPLGPTQA